MKPDPEPYSDFVPAFPALERLELGKLLTDKDGGFWIFIGWRRNTARHEAVFVKPYWSNEHYGIWPLNREPYSYHASSYDTLVRKFPQLLDVLGNINDT